MKPITKINAAEQAHNIEIDRIEPHYQPIIDISSGQIVAYESLARCINNNGEAISAGWVFDERSITLASRLSIDHLLRFKSLDHFSANLSDELLFINVKADWISLQDLSEEPKTLSMIRACGIEPSRVVIEITETEGKISALQNFVTQVKGCGVKIAIDDLGSDTAQVERIIALQADYAKLDMSLFKAAMSNSRSANMLSSLTKLAESCACEIICEGVENEAEFDFAIECGAKKIQGNLFGKARRSTLQRYSQMGKCSLLKRNYLERKSSIIRAKLSKNSERDRAISTIFSAFKQGKVKQLNCTPLFSAGILRIYLCNQDGQLISESNEISKTGIKKDGRRIGCNLCHRPYFVELQAHKQALNVDYIVSTSYLDDISANYCKTYGQQLDDGKIMFIDVVDDTSLFHAK